MTPPPPQVAPHCAYHFLGRLVRRGRRIPCARHCGVDQSGRTDGANLLCSDGVERSVRYRSIGHRFAALWDCPISWHSVGSVPALLGAGEALAHHLRHHRSAGEDAFDWLRCPPSRRGNIIQRRSSQGGDSARSPCHWRPAGAARNHGIVGIQTMGPDRLRTT